MIAEHYWIAVIILNRFVVVGTKKEDPQELRCQLVSIK